MAVIVYYRGVFRGPTVRVGRPSLIPTTNISGILSDEFFGYILEIIPTIPANTDITFEIESNELTWGDKPYKINIYVRNTLGVWTEYLP